MFISCGDAEDTVCLKCRYKEAIETDIQRIKSPGFVFVYQSVASVVL